MDFISNLIKRPISLVLTEQSAITDKTPVSSSLPNTVQTNANEQQPSRDSQQDQLESLEDLQRNVEQQTQRLLSLSSPAFNGNFTDFIGVPEELLGEFDEFLPPPPPTSELLTPTMDNNESSQTPSPPPPPLTTSQMASQTIDLLLSEITDNLTLAGINDEVLAIASPPNNKAELSPLASKSSLNCTKPSTPSSSSSSVSNTQLQTPIKSNEDQQNTAAGSAATSPAVFEANSTLHKFHVDSDLEAGLFDDQHQMSANDLGNNSGVNKSSNKFVGLTEFDEAKIPELPGDLNPNIEEQYNVTFEECFIPTLTANQAPKDPLQFSMAHHLLPKETDNISMSSANDSFVDCQDDTNTLDKDPLADTFLQKPTLNSTVDYYESAAEDDAKEEVVLNATINAEQNVVNPIEFIQQTLPVIEVQQAQDYDEEPMDVDMDMNVTMEILQTSSTNIQNVEKALQHAENILQHLDEKSQELEAPEEFSNEEPKVIGSLTKPTETSKMTFVINNTNATVDETHSQHLEIEQSKHDVSLNKSIELPMNKTKTVSSECIITAVGKEPPLAEEPKVISDKEENLNISKEMAASLTENKNLTMNIMNTSNSSMSSSKSPKLESKLNSTMNTSSSSLKASAPCSPAFPIKPTLDGSSFPKSSKARFESSNKSTYLEKSDYVVELENKLNANENDLCPNTFKEPQMLPAQNRLTFGVDSSEENNFAENKRFTFNVEETTDSSSPPSGMSFPLKEKTENPRRTFCLNTVTESPDKTELVPKENVDSRRTFNVPCAEDVLTKENVDSRRTFNVPCAEDVSTPMETSFEQMDVDEILPQNTTIPLESNNQSLSNTCPLAELSPMTGTQDLAQSPVLQNTHEVEENQTQQTSALSTMQENSSEITATNTSRSNSPPIPTMQNRSDSPPLPTMHHRTDSPPLPTMQTVSDSPPLPATQHRSDSPPLPAMQHRSDSPPLPAMQHRSDSPPLPTMQHRIDSPSVPTKQNKLDTPSQPAMQNRSQSPPLPTLQNQSQSPPLPTLQTRSQSPPLPTLQNVSQSAALSPLQHIAPTLPEEDVHLNEESPSLSTSSEEATNNNQEQLTHPCLAKNLSLTLQSPPLPTIQKRPPIHDINADVLSAKEQSNDKIKDEKDEFVEKCTPSPLDDIFTPVSSTSTAINNSSGFSGFDQNTSTASSIVNNGEHPDDDDFHGNNNLILNPSDFDYLLTKGNNNTPVDRSSLLLKFDPLLGVPVPVNQGQQQLQQQQQQNQLQQQLHLQIPTNINNNPCLSPTIEEDEHNDSTNRSFVVDNARPYSQGVVGRIGSASSTAAAGPASPSSAKLLKERSLQQEVKPQIKRQLPQPGNKKNATMSVDVIKDMSLDNNDCNKTFENSNSTQSDDKQINYKMDELEKKIRNEVLKTEDIEKKLKDAEQREEALIKRITEKDKTVAKMNGVIEAYEKAIAELIAEKEQLIQNYERQLAEAKSDRDSNYHHLTSLETTFSDLHVKYEKSKEMTCQLKANEDGLISESRKNAENLRLQEQRYDKMKNHAMQQLEIANKKLECLTREHAMESTKLKALLKKEEIAKSSMCEQLAQKSKENAELVKICDELISGQGS